MPNIPLRDRFLRGQTLIWLLVALIILGALGVVFVPRLFSNKSDQSVHAAYPTLAQVWNLSQSKHVNLTKLGIMNIDPIIYANADGSTIIGVIYGPDSYTVKRIDSMKSSETTLVDGIPLVNSPLIVPRQIISTDGETLAWLDMNAMIAGNYTTIHYLIIGDMAIHTLAIASNVPEILVDHGVLYWLGANSTLNYFTIFSTMQGIISEITNFPLILYPILYAQEQHQNCPLLRYNLLTKAMDRLPCPNGQVFSQVDQELYALVIINQYTPPSSPYNQFFRLDVLDTTANPPKWNATITVRAIVSHVQINKRIVVWAGPDPNNPNAPSLFVFDRKLNKTLLVEKIFLGAITTPDHFIFETLVNNQVILNIVDINSI